LDREKACHSFTAYGPLLCVSFGMRGGVSLSSFSQTAATTATFNSIGIVVNLPSPATGAKVQVFIKSFGQPASDYPETHPLSQLTPNQCLFEWWPILSLSGP
jgi:hypothetical protein